MDSMGIGKGNVNKSFWNNKKVFITGHTGFKGSWITLWLMNMGSIVKGFALVPNTIPSLFNQLNLKKEINSTTGDIRDLKNLTNSMVNFNPDILIHMAAQPLVRFSYQEPIQTYTTNVIGTANVLEASRKCKNLKSIISVTSDKCYENREITRGYKENEAMGGHDPYSSSKGCAELVTSAYKRSFFNCSNSASIASVRAGNVIAGGDWSKDRLIPDIIRAFEKSEKVVVRNPNSIRPWQHVLEPLSGYLVLAEKLYLYGDQFSGGWNFGPNDEDCKSVRWILDEMVHLWGDNVGWCLDNNDNPHESTFLKLDCSKAKRLLKWEPKLNLEQTLSSIVEWHKVFSFGGNIKEQCIKEINEYKL